MVKSDFKISEDKQQAIADLFLLSDYEELIDELDSITNQVNQAHNAASKALRNLPTQIKIIKQFCNNPDVWERLRNNLLKEYQQATQGKNALRLVNQDQSPYFHQWMNVYNQAHSFKCLVIGWNTGKNNRVKIEKKLALMTKIAKDESKHSPFLFWLLDNIAQSLKTTVDTKSSKLLAGNPEIYTGFKKTVSDWGRVINNATGQTIIKPAIQRKAPSMTGVKTYQDY